MSAQFSSIWPEDRTISGATTPEQSAPESDGDKGVLRILQSHPKTAIIRPFTSHITNHSRKTNKAR